MSNKFIEIVKEKMAQIKKQGKQDEGKTAPEFTFDRAPETEEAEAETKTETPTKH